MSIKIPAGFSLIEGEKPVWHGRMSWKANWPLILFSMFWWATAIFILVTLPFRSLPASFLDSIYIFGLGPGLLSLVLAWLNVISSEYFITNRRVYVKYGIISRKTWDLKWEWITNYFVQQGLIARILNYGDIVISTPGVGAGAAKMMGVSDPMHIKTILEETLLNFGKAKEIEASLRRLEEEYLFGRVTKEKYEEIKAKYEETLKKYGSSMTVTPPASTSTPQYPVPTQPYSSDERVNFCPNCGKKVMSPTNFCSNCGASLTKEVIGTREKQEATATLTKTQTGKPEITVASDKTQKTEDQTRTKEVVVTRSEVLAVWSYVKAAASFFLLMTVSEFVINLAKLRFADFKWPFLTIIFEVVFFSLWYLIHTLLFEDYEGDYYARALFGGLLGFLWVILAQFGFDLTILALVLIPLVFAGTRYHYERRKAKQLERQPSS
jgi:hypothetical protein